VLAAFIKITSARKKTKKRIKETKINREKLKEKVHTVKTITAL